VDSVYIFLKVKAPACNCFRPTTNSSFGTITRFSVQYNTCWCWLNGQMQESSNSNRRYTFTDSAVHRLSFVSMSSS